MMANSENQDGLALLAELDKMQCGQHVIMAESTEHYARREPIAAKRKRRRNLYILLYVIYTFRSAILSLNDQQWLLSMTGDFNHVLGNTKLINQLIFLISICNLNFIIYDHYMEVRHQFTQIDCIFDMISGKQDFKLLDRHRTKFIERSLFVCKLINICQFSFINNFTIISLISIAFVAYFSNIIEHNLPILCLSTLGTIIWLRYNSSMLLTMIMWSFILIEFMKYKFRSIIDMISSNIFLINRGIQQYHNMYRIMAKITKPMNIFISSVYLFYPIFYSYSLGIIFDSKTNKSGTLFMFITAIITFMGNYISFQMLSSISNTNHLFLKHLYPLLTDNSFNRPALRRRIDSFIARLNTEYIGFNCLYFMKFENMTFYEYIIGLSSTYFLVTTNQNYNAIRIFKKN